MEGHSPPAQQGSGVWSSTQRAALRLQPAAPHLRSLLAQVVLLPGLGDVALQVLHLLLRRHDFLGVQVGTDLRGRDPASSPKPSSPNEFGDVCPRPPSCPAPAHRVINAHTKGQPATPQGKLCPGPLHRLGTGRGAQDPPAGCALRLPRRRLPPRCRGTPSGPGPAAGPAAR